MASSMVVAVFLYVLMMRILYEATSWLSSWFSKMMTQEQANQTHLIALITELKNEQLKLNVQDEFAKYARLQRKIHKLNEDLSQQVKQRGSKIAWRRQVMRVIFTGLLAVGHVLFLVMYRKEPVIILPPEWFSPVGSILAFPTGLAGAVGLPCWVLTSNRIISLVLF